MKSLPFPLLVAYETLIIVKYKGIVKHYKLLFAIIQFVF